MTHLVTGTVRVVLAVTALAAAPLMALAQGTPSAAEARKRLELDKSRLNATQRRSKELQADLDKLQAERDRINGRLVETGKRIQHSEAELSVIESRLDALNGQEKQLRGQLEQRHSTISALLAVLQRMGRNPPPVMITRREDALAMVRSAMLLSAAFPELRTQAVGLAKQLADLSTVIKSGRAEREKLAAEKGRHDEARIRLAALQDEKRRASAQHQAELDTVRQEVARIARSVEEMSDLLQRLEKGKGGGPVVELKPSGTQVAALPPQSGRIKSPRSFDQVKGTLQLPAQGRRYLSFGQKTTYGTLSKGIGIQTRHGGQVVAPCDGLIVYAGEFRTYGQLLIISPGGGYHVLLAGLSQIEVQVGQSVLMGEPVGTMAVKSPAGQDGGPVLTVEFRKDQRPIDPDPWWSDASRKVQG
ncbi:MAG TPA: peptidoglycan DD-metalloendopeptidase family protein [Hyphomicrobiaceae bacterium]|nr:peptidoglycan DD-metalloendopeptidase family protein [Hyphomicrobiaceae bacterium]